VIDGLDVAGPQTEAELAFVVWILGQFDSAGLRARWVQENLPRTASLVGVGLDLVREEG
jgi:hypothetical protein